MGGLGGSLLRKAAGVSLQLLRSIVLVVQESEGKEISDTGNVSKATGDGSAPSRVFTMQVACEMRLEKQGANNAGLPMGPPHSQSARRVEAGDL